MTTLLLALVVAVADPEPQTFKLSGSAACPSIPAGLAVPTEIPKAAEFYKRRILMHLHEAWGLGRAPVVFAQIHQESGFGCERVNLKSAASGLAQFIPSTAVLMQRHSDYSKQLMKYCSDAKGCPFDPDWALRALALLDKENYRRYPRAEGDERYGFMLADYNGGSLALRDEISFCATLPACDTTKYFGHVRDACGRRVVAAGEQGGQHASGSATRTVQNCKENTEYPQIILHKLRPRYERWLVPGL